MPDRVGVRSAWVPVAILLSKWILASGTTVGPAGSVPGNLRSLAEWDVRGHVRGFTGVDDGRVAQKDARSSSRHR